MVGLWRACRLKLLSRLSKCWSVYECRLWLSQWGHTVTRGSRAVDHTMAFAPSLPHELKTEAILLLLSPQSISFINELGMFISQTYCHWVIVVAMSREETMCESDTLAWKSLSKQGPWRCPSLGCFFKGIQLVGVICLASRTRGIQGSYHADRIMTVHFNLPHSLCLLTEYLKCTKSVGGA